MQVFFFVIKYNLFNFFFSFDWKLHFISRYIFVVSDLTIGLVVKKHPLPPPPFFYVKILINNQIDPRPLKTLWCIVNRICMIWNQKWNHAPFVVPLENIHPRDFQETVCINSVWMNHLCVTLNWLTWWMEPLTQHTVKVSICNCYRLMWLCSLGILIVICTF